VPGEARRLFVRDTDPNGRFTAPILALRTGRYPTGDEVAVTDEVARNLGAGLGGQLTIDGRTHPVVGIVQNPADYDDEFALVAPGRLERPDNITLLTDGSADVEAFRQQMTVHGNVDRQTRRSGERAKTAMVTLGLAAVGLLLVALIAAAGFVVLAKRRQRQFGLLAAAGATERQVRLVTVINGALVGVVAAVGGTVIGMAAWALALPRVQAGAGHDIAGFSVPLWLLATSLVLAVGAAVASAWWPARAVARIPVMEALSARPPRPQPVHRSAIATVVLVAGGLLCLHLGDGGKKPVLLMVGLPMVLVGVLLSAPVAVRLLGRLAGRLPLTGRLALRDLARYQARSGAALAAISLALAIPVGIVVVATAETAQAANHNLSDRQLLFRIGQEESLEVPIRSDSDVAGLDGQIARLAAGIGNARILPLDMAVDPSVPTDRQFEAGGAQSAAALFWKVPGEDRAHGVPLYVATPA
ncbi:MAG: ABC transporter permease, partial [Actinobacteria bacterium]|nr:ABC transporter permease [Actinomycetota bacterium]